MKQEVGNRKQEVARLVLVRKPVGRVAAVETGVVRDGSTGMVVLPRVWAVGEPVSEVRPLQVVTCAQDAKVRPRPELAFYRKYTEAMLRRYLKMSMANGRVPSMLGRELFRSRVSSYSMTGFDDVVHFCADMEKCLRMLQPEELSVVKRIGLQEYTFGEAAGILGISLRGVIIRYGRAIDRLTGILLAAGLLEAVQGIVREGESERALQPENAVKRPRDIQKA